MATGIYKPVWPAFQLNNSSSLPAIGFGTFTIKDRETIFLVVDAALRAGYRSFDTAAVYRNESFISEALFQFLPKYDLTMDDVHVTSKLSNADHGSKRRVLSAFDSTEANLGFAPNLYLIHFPGAAHMKSNDVRNKTLRHMAWGAMTELYDSGRVESIGVSNFTVSHLQDLLKEYHIDIPVVNQVEWHPYFHDDDLLKYCNQHCIQLQGYHSMGGNQHGGTLQKDPQLKIIAENHSVSVSQILLTWSLQRGVAVIPKSTSSAHIAENIALDFSLTGEEMHTIDSLRSPAEQTKFAWDPRFVF